MMSCRDVVITVQNNCMTSIDSKHMESKKLITLLRILFMHYLVIGFIIKLKHFHFPSSFQDDKFLSACYSNARFLHL